MKKLLILICVSTSFFTSCDTLKNIPTNTSGGFFSLNGSWSLNASSDNAMTGSVITVYPITGTATVNSLSNNTYCIKEKDALWKDIKSTSSGVFSLNALATNCNNSIVYKSASLTVISADEVRLTGQTAGGSALMQTWIRIKN